MIKEASILIAEICILLFLGFFERLIQFINNEYRIDAEGFD